MARRRDALRYLDGVAEILSAVRTTERKSITRAVSTIVRSLRNGGSVFYVGEGHIPPLMNAFGAAGNPNIFLPLDVLLQRLAFTPTRPLRGDVVILSGQYDSSPFLDSIAVRSKLLGAFVILIGTPSDRTAIPIASPAMSLPEICDLTINVLTPPGDGLLTFKGLDVPACPTSGLTAVALFHALNAEVVERLRSPRFGRTR